jgi:membrane protease YdiL (CAAX protease family)
LRERLEALWNRLPVFVRAIAAGWILLEAGSLLSVLPLFGNIKFHPEIPWALPVTCFVLAGIWAWCSGRGPPANAREVRRSWSRSGRLPARLWVAALPAIAFGTLTLVTLRLVAPYLAPVAAPSVSIQLSSYPVATAVGALVAIAVSAAVVEETGFRGYMQKPMEDRYGVVPAILITGVMFWVVHLDKVTVTHLPGHMAASAVFGLLAYFTRSLAPAMVAHATADLVLQPAYFARSPQFVWNSLSARPIWDGKTASAELHTFEALALVLLVSSLVTILAFLHLARTAGGRAAALPRSTAGTPG